MWGEIMKKMFALLLTTALFLIPIQSKANFSDMVLNSTHTTSEEESIQSPNYSSKDSESLPELLVERMNTLLAIGLFTVPFVLIFASEEALKTKLQISSDAKSVEELNEELKNVEDKLMLFQYAVEEYSLESVYVISKSTWKLLESLMDLEKERAKLQGELMKFIPNPGGRDEIWT
jgi:hypothetical protein